MQSGGYYQSWSMPWTSDGPASDLANLSGYTTVMLSFMLPDCSYAGGETFEGTGLQFSSDPPVIKAAIAALRARGVKVLLAIGGATYTNWGQLNAGGIAAFVQEFGLDGVDIDYEPHNPACALADGAISCTTDEEYISVTRTLRDALPRPLTLTSAVWSVGAYGEGQFENAAPACCPHTGVALSMLRNAGDCLDQIHVMSYDAGDDYNAKEAFDAYKAVYGGPILMGVELPPDAVGGHSTNMEEVQALSEHVKNGDGGGLFIWSIQKETSGLTAADFCAVARDVLGAAAP